MAAHGHFGWHELNTHNPDSAKLFCEAAFGWTWEPMPMPEGTYWLAKVGGEPAAGLFPLAGARFENVPDHWLSYLAVDDVDARAAKATAAGSTFIRPPWTVPEIGRLAILQMPGGAILGLMEARPVS